MAKKAKKGKPEKEKKRRGENEEDGLNIPYPGSDRTKALLARLLILLCAIGVGLVIYTVHYIRFVAVKKQQEVAAAAAAELAQTPPVGEAWFLRPDGTFVRADGSPVTPQDSAAQDAPSPEQPPDGEAEDGSAEAETGEPGDSEESSSEQPAEGEQASENT